MEMDAGVLMHGNIGGFFSLVNQFFPMLVAEKQTGKSPAKATLPCDMTESDSTNQGDSHEEFVRLLNASHRQLLGYLALYHPCSDSCLSFRKRKSRLATPQAL
jgi:hypothetical protein